MVTTFFTQYKYSYTRFVYIRHIGKELEPTPHYFIRISFFHMSQQKATIANNPRLTADNHLIHVVPFRLQAKSLVFTHVSTYESCVRNQVS